MSDIEAYTTDRYSIVFRPELNLLDIEWAGHFTGEAVAAYAAELRARFAASGFRPGYRLRIDMSWSAVQSQDALAVFASQFADFPKAERIAIVTRSAIYRMQVRRIMTQPYLRIFDFPEDALEWLVGGE